MEPEPSGRVPCGVQEVARLVEADDYAAAFRVAEEIERVIPDDPTPRALWPRFSRTIAITTTPPGARVSTRGYADKNEAWRDLGVTPLAEVRVPLGMRRWRFAREGAAPVERALPVIGPIDVTVDGAQADTEVLVQGGAINSWITGIDPIERIQVPDYHIDKFEVTNRQFKAFVQAGGYRNREAWEHPFEVEGKGGEPSFRPSSRASRRSSSSPPALRRGPRSRKSIRSTSSRAFASPC